MKVTAKTVLGVNADAAESKTGVYPNPSARVFNVQSDKKVAKIEVWSTDGRKVQEAAGSSQIDLSGKSRGVYLMSVTYSDGISAQQKVIRK